MLIDDWVNPINIAICQVLPFVLVALSARLAVTLLPEAVRRQVLSVPVIAALARPMFTAPKG